MEQLLPNQLEGAYDRDGKGLSAADAMPGGKQRFAIIGSEEFDVAGSCGGKEVLSAKGV